MTASGRNRSYDAVIIGAGINGMVAAAELAGAGWQVALVDERARIGGFIDSGELTLPGYVHDTFSSWHPLFVGGGAYAALGEDLHRHVLIYCNTDGAVTAAVSERGVVIAQRDPEATAESLSDPRDRAAYRRMLAQFGSWAPQVFGALGAELSYRDLTRLSVGGWREHGRAGLEELARVGLQSGRAYVRERFNGWEVDQLWTPWLLHAGLAPDHASGGIMLPVMAASMHGLGLPVVSGGAAQFVHAFEGLLAERGVEIFLGESAEAITVVDGRSNSVIVGSKTLVARRAVLASTATRQLYEDLLPASAVTAQGRAAVYRHRPGRAAMQIHLALDAPVPWADARLAQIPLVHVSNGADSTGVACAQAEAQLLPARPTVVVGQQFVLDPGRVPAGKAALWLQLQEVPFAPAGDVAGRISVDGHWSDGVVSAYVDRVLAQIEQYAPGLRSLVLKTVAFSPVRLSEENRNAVRGDPYGGAVELDQNLLWRPGTRTGHRTGVRDLFHIGAFTHPGPGLGGGSGHIVAQELMRPPALKRAWARFASR